MTAIKFSSRDFKIGIEEKFFRKNWQCVCWENLAEIPFIERNWQKLLLLAMRVFLFGKIGSN